MIWTELNCFLKDNPFQCSETCFYQGWLIDKSDLALMSTNMLRGDTVAHELFSISCPHYSFLRWSRRIQRRLLSRCFLPGWFQMSLGDWFFGASVAFTMRVLLASKSSIKTKRLRHICKAQAYMKQLKSYLTMRILWGTLQYSLRRRYFPEPYIM